MLLKAQKNEVFKLITKQGFDINLFDLRSSPEDQYSYGQTIISYKNTPLSFTFEENSDNFNNFSFSYVKFDRSFTSEKLYSSYAFSTVLVRFNEWLTNHINRYNNEQAEIDLWEDYKQVNTTLNIGKIDFEDKTVFSNEEKQLVTLQLNGLKISIKNQFKLSPQEAAMVSEKLDYLIEATERLNKFDWKSVLVSTIVAISIALTLDTQMGHELFLLFKQAFASLPVLIAGP